tara:strand:+ start:666 stop:914 length:249 start_codon:yes stop_codon:yes gene_type:complete
MEVKQIVTNWVDPYTAELFSNYNLENFDSIDLTKSTHKEVLAALVIDAQNFKETIDTYFTGVSIDYEPEEYASEYLSKFNIR